MPALALIPTLALILTLAPIPALVLIPTLAPIPTWVLILPSLQQALALAILYPISAIN